MNATVSQGPPDDTILDAMVERVDRDLARSLRRARERRRRISIVGRAGAAVLLFASGFALAGATLVPHPAPSYGMQLSPDGKVIPSLLSIGCYDSDIAATPSTTWTENDQPNADLERANPADACSIMRSMMTTHQALLAEAAKLQAGGASCGVIAIEGGATYAWESTSTADGRGGIDFTDATRSGSATGCAAMVEIPALVSEPIPSAVCAVAPNVAAVYPLGGKSAASVCSANSEEVWGD